MSIGSMFAGLFGQGGSQPNPMSQGGPQSPAGGQGGPSSPGQGAAQANPTQAGLAPPQAYQQDPVTGDLVKQLMQVHQRDIAADSINRGLAMMVAGRSPPSQAGQILGSVPPMQDTMGAYGQAMGLQQQAYQAAMQQQAYRAMQSPEFMADIQKQLGLSPAEVQVMAASGKLPELITTMMGGSDIDQRQYMAAARAGTFKGTYTDWRNQGVASGKITSDIATERNNAVNALPAFNNQMDTVESGLNSVLLNPRLKNVLGQWTPTTGQPANFFHDPQDIALAQQIQRLYAQMYSEGFKMGGGARKTQQELTFLGQAAGDTLSSTYLPEDAFKAGLIRLQDQTRAAHANGYGEAGDVSDMPSQYDGYLDPIYRQGGSREAKGAPPALRRPTEDEIKNLPDAIRKFGPDIVRSHLRQQGVDVVGLPGL